MGGLHVRLQIAGRGEGKLIKTKTRVVQRGEVMGSDAL